MAWAAPQCLRRCGHSSVTTSMRPYAYPLPRSAMRSVCSPSVTMSLPKPLALLPLQRPWPPWQAVVISSASSRAATSMHRNWEPFSTGTTPSKTTMSTHPKSARRAGFHNFLPHQIARLAYQLNGDLIEKLRREGINVTRWRILAVLAMGDGITINEIVERAMMQQSALSRALMNMEKEKYIRRALRRDDARYVEVYLTDKGRALFKSLNVVVRRRQKRLLKGFSTQEVTSVFAMLRRMSVNLME